MIRTKTERTQIWPLTISIHLESGYTDVIIFCISSASLLWGAKCICFCGSGAFNVIHKAMSPHGIIFFKTLLLYTPVITIVRVVQREHRSYGL